jgi:hypothetical protein
MKTFAFLFLIVLTTGSALAQTNTPRYEWKATLRAVDESGNPVRGAKAQIGYYVNSQPVNAEGITDTNGMFTASHSALASMVEVSCQAEKPGYYTTWVRRDLGPKYDPTQWIFSQTLVLKKIGKPIAMYAKYVNSEPAAFKKTGQPPVTVNKTIGYDLTVGDWITPYGKGLTTDIIFTEEFNKKSALDYDFKFIISFPNTGDGIQEFTVPDAEKASGLRSPHEALNDGYQSQLIRENFHRPDHTGKTDYDANRNFFFRVRTVLDNKGNIVSTHYGKIYGDPLMMNFRYYLNPTPNSTNIEFDPKQNLLVGLQSFEQVTVP